MDNKEGNLVKIKRTGFANEKEIHQTVENNLKTMLNLTLVDHEFTFGKYRIDTLAFDERKKIFVIIEYKIDEDKKISNQVYGYYGAMITNKPEFLLAYRDNVGKRLNKQEIKWDKTRILLIAPKFDESLINALNAPSVTFELWKIHRYQRGIIELRQLKNINNRIQEADPEIETESTQEPKDLKDHLEKCNKNTRQIYNEIERWIKKMGDGIETLIAKPYISFKINDNNFIRIVALKDRLRIYLPIRLKEMNIPKRSTLIIKQKSHHMGGDSEITIHKQADIIYLVKLVKQSYEASKVDQPKSLSNIKSPKKYTDAEYLDGLYTNVDTHPKIRQLWYKLKKQILANFRGLEFRQRKYYAVFYSTDTKRAICTIQALKSKIVLYYSTTSSRKLSSESDFVKHVPMIDFWPGDYRSDIKNEQDIKRAIPLIKTVYQDKTKS